MKKGISIIFLLIGVIISHAQEEKSQYIRKGLLRSMATISPGILLMENASTISIYGNLEYYIADNISLRGDSYYFLKAKGIESQVFDFNHSIFSGAAYHFKTKNHFDPYFAIEPGIAFTKKESDNPFTSPLESSGSASVNPLISSAFGFNLYFQRWFHLFAEARYISGKHLSDATTQLSLSELRFSFGLGWNINLLKTAN